MKKSSFARRCAFALGSTSLFLALLGLLELGLRACYSEDDLLFSYERPDGIIQSVPGTMQLRPGVHTTIMDGPYRWDVQVNSDRLRANGEIALRKSGDVYRILAIGDSWIFGYSVTQGKTITDRLAQQLSDAIGRPVEVLNAGVPGACAFDMAQLWKAYGNRYEFDALLLGAPHNGGSQQQRMQERSNWYIQTLPGPRSHLRIYLGMRRLMFLASPTSELAPSLAISANNRGESSVQATLYDVAQIAREAKQSGHAVWFADFPGNANGALSLTADTRRITPAWAEALEPLGVIIAGHALDGRSCWGFYDQVHPSEAGANATAQVMAAAILRGTSGSARESSPRCLDVEGIGPGKDGWPVVPLGEKWKSVEKP